MNYKSIWRPILINRSNRPILSNGEYNVLIIDNTGLYQGKSKIIGRQNGRLYLTNKRIIYFDNDKIDNSIGVELVNIVSLELIDRFLRSSPKVKLFIKSTESTKIISINWTCKICSFINHIKSNFDFNEDELPKCTSCGIKPNKDYLREVIRDSNQKPTTKIVQSSSNGHCPRCTFINHPSIKFCEMCGTELVNFNEELKEDLLDLELLGDEIYTDDKPYIKISFRKGGEKKFYQEVANLIDEISWENIKNKGGVNQNGIKINNNETESRKTNGAGIHALEQIGELQRIQNEVILSTSLDDIEQLMFKYQDLLKLSNSFGLKQNANEFVIPPLNIKKSSSLYHQELSRHISEYLVTYKLTTNSSMITSQDLYAEYNRFLVGSQGFGCELIDSNDFLKSIEMFETLNLPVTLRDYKSGLVVVAPRNLKHIYGEYITEYLKKQEHEFKYLKMRSEMIEEDELNENYGKTISQISKNFNWSYNITIEELEKCIESGLIVIDQSISGTFYYINKFTYIDDDWDDSTEIEEIKLQLIEEQKLITQNLKSEFELKYQNDLIKPNYSFGTIRTPISHSESPSLQDLAGLNFNI
ncbi:unnamed protein product [Candida verbasci]|uniref:Vacuolar protein-sorting-associated protein 36 n=1 Tax=Candida verbasci TaxID=1227364 RepID=A0A9W4XBS1_9ASCO|nr:unnamed protein product [Candida verbasci]